MGEPLFDGISAAIVFFGSVAVIVLRSGGVDAENVEHTRRLHLAGNLLLGIAVSLLLYRWIDAVTLLPAVARPNVWLSGVLSAACGIGIVAAVKAAIAESIARRIQYFLIAAISGVISLAIASAWDWALLLLALLSSGIALAQWSSKRTRVADPSPDDGEAPREPALVLTVSALLLLLSLGTWQHVIANEAQRQTRSSRYSAWPRTTALRNAWERTGWTVKSDDEKSAKRVAEVASQEQCIALGLGSLLLVVTVAACCRTSREPTISESDHAG